MQTYTASETLPDGRTRVLVAGLTLPQMLAHRFAGSTWAVSWSQDPAATPPTRADVAVIVAGEDHDGNHVPRALTPHRVSVLRGEFGRGFDLSGPHAAMCHECGIPLFADAGHRVISALQRHHSTAHGQDYGLLPRTAA